MRYPKNSSVAPYALAEFLSEIIMQVSGLGVVVRRETKVAKGRGVERDQMIGDKWGS